MPPSLSPKYPDMLYVLAKVKEGLAFKSAVLNTMGGSLNSYTEATVDGLHVGSFEKGGLTCAVVYGTQQGPESAGILTTRALLTLRPRAAAMVGICAGNRAALYKAVGSKAKTDDELEAAAPKIAKGGVFVVCAASALNIGDGANEGNGSITRSQHTLQSIADRPKECLQEAVQAGSPRDKYVQESAPMLTSPQLELNFNFKALENSDRVFGLDMEASAFIRACNGVHGGLNEKDIAHCLGVYKGVSDFADELSRRDDAHQDMTGPCVAKAFTVAHTAALKLFGLGSDVGGTRDPHLLHGECCVISRAARARL